MARKEETIITQMTEFNIYTETLDPMQRGTLAKKKETTMSQMTSLQKALKHCAKVRVFVATTRVAVRKAQAPVGRGSSTSPARSNTLP